MPNRIEEVPLAATGQEERSDAQSSTIPTGVPPQYVDSGLLVQIVKTVMEGMTGLMTQATPATQIPQVAVVNVVTTDNMVLLAQLVKSMREMGCNRIWGNKMQR
jgi:excinuclease UvrABC helicase subunit UvrB